jgi:hypothetical protein
VRSSSVTSRSSTTLVVRRAQGELGVDVDQLALPGLLVLGVHLDLAAAGLLGLALLEQLVADVVAHRLLELAAALFEAVFLLLDHHLARGGESGLERRGQLALERWTWRLRSSSTSSQSRGRCPGAGRRRGGPLGGGARGERVADAAAADRQRQRMHPMMAGLAQIVDGELLDGQEHEGVGAVRDRALPDDPPRRRVGPPGKRKLANVDMTR